MGNKYKLEYLYDNESYSTRFVRRVPIKEDTEMEKKTPKIDYAVITEQGDLGLGVDVLKPTEQKIVNESDKNK